MQSPNVPMSRRMTGFTLIEVMIVTVIIAVIASFAYPSYTQYVVKAKRSAAQSMLLQVADRQQQFFMDNKRFAATLTDLNFPANPFMISSEGNIVAAGDDARIYQIEIAASTPTTYQLQAVPQGVQASKDTKCGTLSFDETGMKGAGGSVADCW